MRLVLISSAVVVLASVLAAQTTHTVPGNFPTVQAAINAAQNGDTITVAAGIYVENIDFLGKAITVSGAGAPGCVIDGAGMPVVTFDSAETHASVLEGFTIRNGVGDASSPGRWGGGISVINASPTLRNLEVRNCTGATTSSLPVGGGEPPPGAGGIYLGSSAAVVERCAIHDCNAPLAGANPGAGGLQVHGGAPTIRDCEVFGNAGGTPTAFGAVAGPGGVGFSGGTLAVITRTVIRDNVGGDSVGFGFSTGAGGVQVTSGAVPVVDQCVIIDNVAGGYSPLSVGANLIGAAAVGVRNAGLVLVNCVVRGNQASLPAPSLSSPTLLALVFAGAQAGATFVVNSVVRENLVDLELGISANSQVVVRHCNIQGFAPGVGNFDADPEWVDPDAGDFHLLPTSPCIDAGDPAIQVPIASDLDGDPRFFGPAVDLGVDEVVHPCFRGEVEDGAGNVVPVLVVDGETVEARVEVNEALSLSVTNPPLTTGSPFVLFAYVGVPDTATVTPLPFGLGDFCFGGGPQTLLLASSFGVDPNALVPSTVTPWTLAIPGIPIPMRLTFQGLILQTASQLAVTNAVVLRVLLPSAPTITSVTPAAPVAGDTVVVTGTAFDSSAVVSVGAVPVSSPTITPTMITFTAPAAPCASVLTVTNPDQQSATAALGPPVSIATAAPLSGPAAGGNTVHLTGYFPPGLTVTIGGQAVTSFFNLSNIVGVTMPPGAPGTVSIVLTGPDGCAEQVQYTYL